MENYQFSFEKLDVWHKARNLVKKIYLITKIFPEDEKFALTSQIRRAAISVPANIAEGSSRFSKKDQAHFYQIAYSSLMELMNHLYISLDLEYINSETINNFKPVVAEISRMINSLYKSH